VAVSRLAIAYLVGNEAPNEGHFRPLEVLTRPASIFHPVRPAPSFMYGVPSDHAIEMIITALAPALPDLVPASSGGDICSLVWWGTREETGEPWADGAPHPVGLGASRQGDGASTMIFHSESATRFTPAEIWEARNPWLIEQCALAIDSGGAGQFRGGLGLNLSFRVLEDCYITVAVARTKLNPWGLEGGQEGRPNDLVIEYADGTAQSHSLSTRVALPKGTVVHLRSGSGGGHGDPAARDLALIRRDLDEGYITWPYAQEHYPQLNRADG
jgi:N-methylhydantoinase B